MSADTQDKTHAGALFLFLSGVISGGIGGFLGNLLTKLFLEETAQQTSIWPTAVGVLVFAISIAVTFHHWTVLGYGGFPKGSQERERYNRLRTTLRGGGRIGQVYERMLGTTLYAVDGFFGDKDRPSSPMLQRIFGLRETAPLWTGNSYDRCLLIALVYPIAVILGVWVIAGHVGPAEAALHLPSQADAATRGFAIAGVAVIWFGGSRYYSAEEWRTELRWLILLAIGLALTMLVVGAVIAFAALALSLGISERKAAAGLISLAFILIMIYLISQLSILVIAPVVTMLFLIMLIVLGRDVAFHPVLLACGSILIFLLALVSAPAMSLESSWNDTGPLLLFVIILTLVNAPFDWLTLGLTRALLRRGLELGGFWPLLFGTLDLFVGAAVVVGLAVATLLAAQLFAVATAWGGGTVVVDVQVMLAALADPYRRTEPEYWWLYAMLFSTLLPSIVNVALGALSLMRGVPGSYQLLARRMPVGKPVLESERIWIAPLLTLQWILSVVIGLVTMLGLLWAILAWGLPLLGVNLIPMLQQLAEMNLPRGLLRLLGIG